MKASTILIFLFIFGIISCSDDDMDPQDCPEITSGTRFFEFQHDSGELFVAWTAKADVLATVDAELELAFENRGHHINGRILENNRDCNVNYEWSWYFDPDDWSLAEVSIELCDGNPQYVEENLDEYISTGRYCPWGSKLFREINAPF